MSLPKAVTSKLVDSIATGLMDVINTDDLDDVMDELYQEIISAVCDRMSLTEDQQIELEHRLSFKIEILPE